MGTSTDAILYFGFDLGSEEDLDAPWIEEDMEVDAFIAAKWGVVEPNGPFTGNEAAYREYWEKEKSIIDRLDCHVDIHCSSNYYCYFVAIKSKTLTARRGYPESFDKSFLDVSKEDIDKLKRYCELAEITWEDPSWAIASYWG